MATKHTLRITVPRRVADYGDPAAFVNNEIHSYAAGIRSKVLTVEDHGTVLTNRFEYVRELIITTTKIRGIEYKPVTRRYRRKAWQRNY